MNYVNSICWKDVFRLLLSPFLGEKSSRDEQVACAMLATQLDNFLGGDPVQHRQVQGYESPEFMNLFPRGVSYKVRCEIMWTHTTTQEKWYKAANGVVP